MEGKKFGTYLYLFQSMKRHKLSKETPGPILGPFSGVKILGGSVQATSHQSKDEQAVLSWRGDATDGVWFLDDNFLTKCDELVDANKMNRELLQGLILTAAEDDFFDDSEVIEDKANETVIGYSHFHIVNALYDPDNAPNTVFKLGPKCHHCDGHGRLPLTRNDKSFRIVWHYNGEREECSRKFRSLSLARQYVGVGCGHTSKETYEIIGPDGRVYG